MRWCCWSRKCWTGSRSDSAWRFWFEVFKSVILCFLFIFIYNIFHLIYNIYHILALANKNNESECWDDAQRLYLLHTFVVKILFFIFLFITSQHLLLLPKTSKVSAEMMHDFINIMNLSWCSSLLFSTFFIEQQAT